MKTHLVFSALLSLCLLGATGCKEQSLPAKAKAVANDGSLALKKAKHRVDEVTCLDSDLECLAKKAANRIDEAATATGHVVEEVSEKIVGE